MFHYVGILKLKQVMIDEYDSADKTIKYKTETSIVVIPHKTIW